MGFCWAQAGPASAAMIAAAMKALTRIVPPGSCSGRFAGLIINPKSAHVNELSLLDLRKIGNDRHYKRLPASKNALWDVDRDRLRQADPHHGVSPDAGVSVFVCAVRSLAAGVFRLEYKAADQRTDHDKRERRGR